MQSITDLHRARYPQAHAQVAWLLAKSRLTTDTSQAWGFLEAAHLVGQTRFALHMQTHSAMLYRACKERNLSESLAQMFRLALVPFGHLLQRLPLGNPGSARVSAFADVPVSISLQQLIAQSEKAITP